MLRLGSDSLLILMAIVCSFCWITIVFIFGESKRLTIFVNIDEPGLNNYSGGDVAAPLFAAISNDVLNYLNE